MKPLAAMTWDPSLGPRVITDLKTVRMIQRLQAQGISIATQRRLTGMVRDQGTGRIVLRNGRFFR